uniref:uncharacterized protein LOC120328894 isoform X1 n=2 Tax=Styela clava TaxID=7725 RepID=UPI001939E0FE|nr:uncharacterized protein LOC120328894 isoform X1 [Styela clava]
MDLFGFIFAIFLIRKNVFAVEISMEVQVGGAATPGCIGGDKLTAADLEELGKELEKKIEAALLENPGSDIIITTNFYQGDKFHSTQVTNYDATTIANQDLYTCDVTLGMICYWLVRGEFRYSEAEEACRANGNYEVAVIPDENTYDMVVQFLTTKLTTTQLFIWIGSEISDEVYLMEFISWIGCGYDHLFMIVFLLQ